LQKAFEVTILHLRFSLARSAMRAAMVLLTVALLCACEPADRAPTDKATLYLLYNYSGKPVLAATVEDSAGGQGNLETPIPDRYLAAFGTAHPPGKGDYSIVVQWISGQGRVQWLQARLPVKIEQRTGDRLEIYIRPDQFVCASLLDSAHTWESDSAEWARVNQDRSTLSCVKPEYLPSPAPHAAMGFKLDRVTHSWSRHDRPGTKSITKELLWHTTGQVKFRFGGFRGGPWYLNEFNSIRLIGDETAVLVNAPLRPAVSGFYIVLGNERGWSYRFLGQLNDSEVWLSDTRVLIGDTLFVDIMSGTIYRLPYVAHGNAFVLGQSDDGKSLALHVETDDFGMRQGHPFVSEITAMNLETGALTKVADTSSLSVPENTFARDFYIDWYQKHCVWSATDAVVLKCKGETL